MDLSNTTVSDIVKNDFRTSEVFDKYGIDFCCGGNISVAEASKQNQVNTDQLVQELNQKMSESDEENIKYDSWPLDLLASYIQKKHHRYVESAIPVLNAYLDKIANVHGENHPELYEINDLFKASAGELTKHMKKEEMMVFPYVEKLVNIKETGSEERQKPGFGSIANPIAQMEAEHEAEGDRFKKIAELSNNYNPPADACNTYMVAFEKLKAFESDLHIHIHLENNILFPKAKELEQSMELDHA